MYHTYRFFSKRNLEKIENNHKCLTKAARSESKLYSGILQEKENFGPELKQVAIQKGSVESYFKHFSNF